MGPEEVRTNHLTNEALVLFDERLPDIDRIHQEGLTQDKDMNLALACVSLVAGMLWARRAKLAEMETELGVRPAESDSIPSANKDEVFVISRDIRVGGELINVSAYRHDTRSYRVRRQLEAFDFVEGLACGVRATGDYFLAIIKVGMEHRVAELPSEIDGIAIVPRLGGLDAD